MTPDELTGLRIQCKALAPWGCVTSRLTLELIAELAKITGLNLGLAERCAFQSELLAKRSERADPTIVKPVWLRSVGFTDACEIEGELLRSPPSQPLMPLPSAYLMRVTTVKESWWEIRNWDGDAVECGPFETRSEVLAVCAALFIPLSETPASAQAVEDLR